MTFHHLSLRERYQISVLLKEGLTQAQMALNPGRHKSTINGEIARNTGFRGYRPKQVDHRATVRFEGCRNAPRISAQVWKDEEKQLEKQFSPEQIIASIHISHETVYRNIYADKGSGGDLWLHLRCEMMRRKRYGGGRDRRGPISDRRRISERLVDIDKLRQVGHWEGVTIIGTNHKQATVILVERKLGYAVRANVSQKTGDLVSSGIIRRQKGVAALVKTITYDNGKEFAGHARLDCTLKFKGFFVETFSSWQRGANENLNGLIRQYISKKKLPISTLTDTELAMIEDRLKNRPRKRLGFKTRHELFSQSLNRLGLRMRIQERIYG